MTFPAVAAFALLLLEPESAIAMPPTATAIVAMPAAMDVVSLRLLQILRLSVMVVIPCTCGLVVEPTMRREPQSSR
jgi:hypothetical protein